MNERQKRFAEFYAASGNAAEAARLAGYSERTARSQGQRLLTDVDILRYIQELQDKAAAGRIASMVQIRAFWSDTIRDSEARLADRLKASELLAKAAGAFVHLSPHGDDAAFVGQSDGEDVIIYLPALEDETACEYHDEEPKGGGVL